MAILGWLLWGALSASAHDLYPIRPVRATLRVEPDRVVADLRADSIFWIEEVAGLHPMPPRDWPAGTLAKVEAYANSHFRLASDGKTLPGRLVSARYRQFPWEVNEEGTFFLRLVYPAAPPGSALSGSARFYEEYRRELESEMKDRPIPFAESYRTVVEIPGRRRLNFTLTPGAPAFMASIDEARRTPWAMALEGFRRGLETALGTAAGFPALLAIALCLGAGRPLRETAVVLLVLSAAGLAGGRAPDAPWLIWIATLGASLAAGRRFAFPAGAMAAGCLGVAWAAVAKPLLPHSAFAFPSALAGTAAAGAVVLTILRMGVRAERRRLAGVSESRVDELFARRTRLFATVLVMVGAYGLWQSLQR